MKFHRLKVIVFGARYASYCIIPALKKSGLVDIIGICSKSKKNRENVANLHNIKNIFSNVDDALNKFKFDIATIAVPPNIQEEIALKCINKGIHIFAEKPLATTFKSADFLYKKAKENKVKTAVDFLYPEILIWKKAKKFLINNQIGNLNHLIINWNIESYDNKNKFKTWKTNSDLGGGSFSHFGSHILHYLEWFCGPISKVNTNLYSYPNYFDNGDTLASISVLFKNGISSTINLCTAAPNGLGHRLDFYGTEGSLSLINDGKSYLDFSLKMVNKKNKITIPIASKKYNANSNLDQRVYPITRLIKRFVISILKDYNFHPSFKEACEVQFFLEKRFNSVNKS